MVKVAAIAGVALVVLAAVAAVLIVLMPGAKVDPPVPLSQTSAAPASSASTLTINGEVVLPVTFDSVKSGDWPSCSGTEAHADISSGAQVTVTDAAGKTIGLAQLDPGVRRERGCVFFFKVLNVPTGGDFYGVEVVRRGRVRYSAAQLTYPIRQTITVGG